MSKPVESGSVKVTKKKPEKDDPKAVDAKALLAKMEEAQRVIREQMGSTVTETDMKHLVSMCNLEWSPGRGVESHLEQLIAALKKDHEYQAEHGEANKYNYLTDALVEIEFADLYKQVYSCGDYSLTPDERVPGPYACMEYEDAAKTLKYWGFKLTKPSTIATAVEDACVQENPSRNKEEEHPLTKAYVRAYMKLKLHQEYNRQVPYTKK